MNYRPTVAIVPLGHYVYFQQFEGLYQELSQKAAAFAEHFDASTNVIVTDYVDTVDAAIATSRDLKAKDVDGIFMLLTTYLPSALAAPFARYLDVPQILVAVQPLAHLDYKRCTTYMQLANDDVCAMPEISGVYARLGRTVPPCIVAADCQQDSLRREVCSWQHAIAAKAAFKYQKFGYLGHTYEGMYDMHTDPTAFYATFGAHVQILEMCELAALTEAVAPAALAEKTQCILDTFSIQDPSVDPLTDHVQPEDLAWSARIACALDALIEKHGLRALAYYYKGEVGNLYERIGAAMIVGNTLLTSNGTPLAGEADLKTAAAMLILHALGGGGSFAEIHPFDVTEDCVLVGHDGPHNIAISHGKPVLRKLKKYHGKAGSGIGVEFSLRTGPVTLLSITYLGNGRFKMVAASGISVPGDIPQTGNTNTRVQFPMPVTEFLRRWCEAGPTHHFALGTGDLTPELRKLARIMDIDLEVIG